MTSTIFAFPGVIGPPSEFSNGMTLRDYIAVAVLPDILRHEGERQPFCDVAELAYDLADEMMKARDREKRRDPVPPSQEEKP